jgi:outer membrane protein
MKRQLLQAIFFILPAFSWAQSGGAYTLAKIVQMARSQSAKVMIAATKKETGLYRYQQYRSELKPYITLYGNLPAYTKEYYAVRQPNGTLQYQLINQNNSSLGFGISQHLLFSGGELSLNTDMSRFDDFKAKRKQYSTTPVYLRLVQPLFAVNEFKWNKKIEPLKLEIAKREFVLEAEKAAQQAQGLFFDAIDIRTDIETAEHNFINIQTIYDIEKKRIVLGTTTEDRLLQLELQLIRTRQSLQKAQVNYQAAMISLKTFLGIDPAVQFSLELPDTLPPLVADLNMIVSKAKKNRPEYADFVIKKLEAAREVARTTVGKRQINIVASYGLNNAAAELPQVYRDFNDQQRFSVGFNLPIADWGRRRAKNDMAKATQKMVDIENAYNESLIREELIKLINGIALSKSDIIAAKKADTIAVRRYEIAYTMYQKGKVSLNELSIARAEKDEVRRSYIYALRVYWGMYYMLRALTLFDFEKNEDLIVE